MSRWLGNSGTAEWAERRRLATLDGFEVFWDEERGVYIDHIVNGVPGRAAAQHCGAAVMPSTTAMLLSGTAQVWCVLSCGALLLSCCPARYCCCAAVLQSNPAVLRGTAAVLLPCMVLMRCCCPGGHCCCAAAWVLLRWTTGSTGSRRWASTRAHQCQHASALAEPDHGRAAPHPPPALWPRPAAGTPSTTTLTRTRSRSRPT